MGGKNIKDSKEVSNDCHSKVHCCSKCGKHMVDYLVYRGYKYCAICNKQVRNRIKNN